MIYRIKGEGARVKIEVSGFRSQGEWWKVKG